MGNEVPETNWQREARTDDEIISALATEVATELEKLTGASWAVTAYGPNEYSRMCYLKRNGSDEVVISLALDWRNKSLADGVELLELQVDGADAVVVLVVTMSAAVLRGPKAIAADINRKVLPSYLARVEKLRAKRENRLARLSNRGRAIAEVMLALDGTGLVTGTENDRDENTNALRIGTWSSGANGKATFDYDGSIATLELRGLSVAALTAILVTLAREVGA